jgi:uncharacterized Zn-finger protein
MDTHGGVQPVEIVQVNQRRVACDGDGPLGHPRVFLTLDDAGSVDCPYCGRRFVLQEGAEAAGEGH